jgi:D-aspartate ligase
VIDTSTPAVVFKTDPNVMHHGGLGVIRSLGRLGVPVYGVHEDSLAPAAHSRYLRGRCLWNPDPNDAEELLYGLADLAERIGRPSVLIPTDDAAAILLAEHGDALHGMYRFARSPRDLLPQVAGKYSLYELCRGLDVPCPQAMLVETWEQARDFAAKVGYPVVAKLATPWLSDAHDVRSSTIVRSVKQLADLHERCEQAGLVSRLMLQEYLPGGAGHDWFVHGYCDGDSVCRPAFVGVKERSYPAHAGLTTLGRCADNDVLLRHATVLLEKLGYRGIVDLDFRWDDRDEQYKLLDFNPRLGAQFRLFRDSAGVDVAIASYLDLTGQEIPQGRPPVGRRFLVENYDPFAALGYRRRRELGLWSWLASLRRVRETAWFARDDLVPFVLMCVWMCWRAVTRSFSQRTRHPDLVRPHYVPGRNHTPECLRRRDEPLLQRTATDSQSRGPRTRGGASRPTAGG